MVRNPYRRAFWRHTVLWLLIFAAVVSISAGIGVYIGRTYYPNTALWDQALAEARVQAESDYYRGVLSSCVGIGMQMSMPRELVAATCQAYWLAAYKADWYTELSPDSWQWPPEAE